MRRSLGAEYDRLTRCEPAGYPRWLLEPYVREFVNTPRQSWWMNDLANETRRIYIDQEHKNIDGTHSPEGDSVGFWVGDMLIVHTVDIYPNDYFRGQPPTSNQFESVEVWRMLTMANGEPAADRQCDVLRLAVSAASSHGRLYVPAEHGAGGGGLSNSPLGMRQQRELVSRPGPERQTLDAVPSAGRSRI